MPRSAKSTRPTGGNCYSRAADLLLDAKHDGELHAILTKHAIQVIDSGLRLCHGQAVGQGKIAGIVHGHAWIEAEDYRTGNIWCIDFSNGNQTVLPRETYYHIGQIDTRTVDRFDKHKTRRMLVAYNHYGPWED